MESGHLLKKKLCNETENIFSEIVIIIVLYIGKWC